MCISKWSLSVRLVITCECSQFTAFILQYIKSISTTTRGCPLTLRTNYRCVQSLNISVDVTKTCVENIHKFTKYTHFLSVTKNDYWWTIYSWQGFNSLGCPLMLRTSDYRCVQWLKHLSCVLLTYLPNVWKKSFTNSLGKIVHSLLAVTKEHVFLLIEQSIRGKISTHEDVLLY